MNTPPKAREVLAEGVGADLIIGTVLGQHAVRLAFGRGDGLELGTYLTPQQARWAAASLLQCADAVEAALGCQAETGQVMGKPQPEGEGQ